MWVESQIQQNHCSKQVRISQTENWRLNRDKFPIVSIGQNLKANLPNGTPQTAKLKPYRRVETIPYPIQNGKKNIWVFNKYSHSAWVRIWSFLFQSFPSPFSHSDLPPAVLLVSQVKWPNDQKLALWKLIENAFWVELLCFFFYFFFSISIVILIVWWLEPGKQIKLWVADCDGW